MRAYSSLLLRDRPLTSVLCVALAFGCSDGDPAPVDQGGGDQGAAPSDMSVSPDLSVVPDVGVAPDLGGPRAADCTDGVGPSGGSPFALVNEFVSADGTVRIAFAIQQDPDGFGTSGTTIYEPLRFGLVHDGVYTCITDPLLLTYTISHHNFDDSLSVTIGGTVYTWTADIPDYGSPDNAFRATIEPMFGPAELVELNSVSCFTTPLTRRCFSDAPW